MRTRGFEIVEEKHQKSDFLELPEQGSAHSAGYDFKMPVDTILKPGEKTLVFTNVKAYMQNGEVLELHIRSSVGVKKGIILSNATGIIDADYYNNSSNDGNIGIPLHNISQKTVHLVKGEGIAQGIFKPVLRSDNCNSTGGRDGGFGSTDKIKISTCKYCNFASKITMAGVMCRKTGVNYPVKGDPEIFSCPSFKHK